MSDGPHDAAQALRCVDEELVPGGVTPGVVHDLEVVEVEEEDGRSGLLVGPPEPVDRGGDTFCEQHAVRQAVSASWKAWWRSCSLSAVSSSSDCSSRPFSSTTAAWPQKVENIGTSSALNVGGSPVRSPTITRPTTSRFAVSTPIIAVTQATRG